MAICQQTPLARSAKELLKTSKGERAVHSRDHTHRSCRCFADVLYAHDFSRRTIVTATVAAHGADVVASHSIADLPFAFIATAIASMATEATLAVG